MDPVEPWIDGNAVRRLAAQLLATPNSPEISDSPDAGFGPGFEGFTSGVAEPEIAPTPPVVRQDPEATPIPQPEPEPVQRAPEVVERLAPVAPPEPRLEPEVSSKDEAKPFLAATTADVVVPPVEDDSSDHPFRNVSQPVRNHDGERKRGPLMERMLRFRDWLSRHADARSVFVLDRDGQPVLDDPAYAKLHFLARSLSQAYRPVPGQPGNVHVKVGSDAYLVVIPVDTAFGCLVLGTVLPRPLDASSVEVVARALADAARPEAS